MITTYKAFNIDTPRGELQPTYATAASHKWIKRKATDNNVKMVAVIEALIDHAENSESVFKHLLSLLKLQNYVISQGGKLSDTQTETIEKVLLKYGLE